MSGQDKDECIDTLRSAGFDINNLNLYGPDGSYIWFVVRFSDDEVADMRLYYRAPTDESREKAKEMMEKQKQTMEENKLAYEEEKNRIPDISEYTSLEYTLAYEDALVEQDIHKDEDYTSEFFKQDVPYRMKNIEPGFANVEFALETNVGNEDETRYIFYLQNTNIVKYSDYFEDVDMWEPVYTDGFKTVRGDGREVEHKDFVLKDKKVYDDMWLIGIHDEIPSDIKSNTVTKEFVWDKENNAFSRKNKMHLFVNWEYNDGKKIEMDVIFQEIKTKHEEWDFHDYRLAGATITEDGVTREEVAVAQYDEYYTAELNGKLDSYRDKLSVPEPVQKFFEEN